MRKKKPDGNEPPRLMTVRELSRYLGVHYSTIYRMANEGTIPSLRIGGSWRFRRDGIEAFLAAIEQGPK